MTHPQPSIESILHKQFSFLVLETTLIFTFDFSIIAGIDSAFAGGAVYDAMRSDLMMQTIMKTIVPPAAIIGQCQLQYWHSICTENEE